MARDERTYVVIGAAMEVHRQLGVGFLEAVYQDALAMEMSARNIPFAREAGLPIFYKGEQIPTVYRADFVCFENVVVELKAIKKLSGNEISQILNYLKATQSPIGLLINFGNKSLEYKRFVNTTSNNLRKSV